MTIFAISVTRETFLFIYIPGGGTRVPAKLVDLDPQAHKFAEVWGWRILVGEYFSADYVPAPFQYRWVKTANASNGDQAQAAAGQSQLTNIAWNKNTSDKSPILKELRIVAGKTSGNLSIRFNMDAFNETPQDPYFGWGRITGIFCNYRSKECTSDIVVALCRNPRKHSQGLKPGPTNRIGHICKNVFFFFTVYLDHIWQPPG